MLLFVETYESLEMVRMHVSIKLSCSVALFNSGYMLYFGYICQIFICFELSFHLAFGPWFTTQY